MSVDILNQLRLAYVQAGSQRDASTSLSKAYAAGQASSAIDVAAYLTVRMPATYAAISAVLAQLPELAPNSMLDIGAGPGTASLAAFEHWPDLRHFTLVESDKRFVQFARDNLSNHLPQVEVQQNTLQNFSGKADLVMAAYVLAELPEAQMAVVAAKLWNATQGALVLIEPGTKAGFARIRSVRQTLIKSGAYLIGPCPHAEICPLAQEDWCHFKTRLARSRDHMHAKGATVPFEDEAYSWVAFSRQELPRATARIIASPVLTKPGVELKLCSETGIVQTSIAARDKERYKRARKAKWGDAIFEP